jgi:hypothetical protein
MECLIFGALNPSKSGLIHKLIVKHIVTQHWTAGSRNKIILRKLVHKHIVKHIVAVCRLEGGAMITGRPPLYPTGTGTGVLVA